MDWIIGNAGNMVDIALKIVGAFAVIATMTPNESDNKIADGLMRLVNMLGANFGKSSNL
ncbi:MAG: hypothetical protein ACXABY_09105 [Candidatus Thorarchaeota archaeon]|jgi:hypothetical protein